MRFMLMAIIFWLAFNDQIIKKSIYLETDYAIIKLSTKIFKKKMDIHLPVKYFLSSKHLFFREINISSISLKINKLA